MKKKGFGNIRQLERRMMLDAAAVAVIADAVLTFDASDIDGDGNTNDQASLNDPTADMTLDVEHDVAASGGTSLINTSGSPGTINQSALNANANATFVFDLTFPAGAQQGCIFELGGTGRGTYIGFDNAGNFVARAGYGGTSAATVDAQTALIRFDPTTDPDPNRNILGKSGSLITEIDVTNKTISVWFKEGGLGSDSDLVLLGTDDAPSGIGGSANNWSGGNAGAVGTTNSSIPGNETSTPLFNGAITNFQYFNGEVLSDSLNVSTLADSAADPTGGVLNTATASGTAPQLDLDAFDETLAGIDFSNTTGWLEIPSSNDMNLDAGGFDAKSFAFAFKTGDLTSDQIIYEQGDTNSGYVLGIFDADGAGPGTDYHLYAYAYGNLDDANGANDVSAIVDLGKIAANTEYSAAIVHDGNNGAGTFSASLNGGTLITAGTDLALVPAHADNGAIGGQTGALINPFDLTDGGAQITGLDFDGAIAEVRSWNTALTTTELDAIGVYFADKWGMDPAGSPVIVTNGGSTVTEGESDTIDNTELSADNVTTDWYDDDWDYRQDITIGAGNIDADLTDFTILLTGDNFGDEFWDNVQNDGGDIVMTSADGTTKLNLELVSIDTVAKTMELHVKVPLISSTLDTELFIYYGNAAANEASDAVNTFSNYDHVYHMNELNAVDSVGGNDGTNNGGGAIVAGAIGSAHEYSGAGIVDIADITGTDIRTISFWYNPDSQGGGNYGSVLGSSGYNDGIRHTGTDEINVRRSGGIVVSSTPDFGDYKHLVFSYDDVAGTISVFENGVLQDSSAFAGWYTVDNLIGISDATNRAPDGIVDEIRITSNILDINWAAAEYANQVDPSSFYTVGAQESIVTYEITTDVSNGTLYLDANGNDIVDGGEAITLNDTFTQRDIDDGLLKYFHDDSELPTDSFEFTITNGLATTGTKTFEITVDPVNDAPPVFEGWTLVSHEDFEGGAAGWSDNTTTNGGANFSEYLGRFSQDGDVQTNSKTFNLSGAQNQVVITFDMYEIDTWDNEYFSIFINEADGSGNEVIREQMRYQTFNRPNDGESGNVSWTVEELSTINTNLGHGSSADQMYRYTLTIETADPTITIGFGSNLNSAASAESWGIDNLSVYEVGPAGGNPTFEVAESATNGTVVGQVSATDADLDTLVYTIENGDTDNIFSINSDGEIIVSNNANLNYEATTSYTLTVRATDPFGLLDEQTVTVNITDVLENTAPVIANPGTQTIAENTTVGTVVVDVNATDPEGDNITYSINNGNQDGIFAIDSTTGVITVTDTTNLNFERDASYTLQIRARDDGFGALSAYRNVVINISDINEAPTFDEVQKVIQSNANVMYSNDTGNFYQYINSARNYNAATADAAARTLNNSNGTGGHLVTITSAAENTFVDNMIFNTIWLGATDAPVEDTWRWVGGENDGDHFWQGNGTGSGGAAQGGFYANWNSTNEPGGADYAEMRTNGKWYDRSGGNRRYVVEWDGSEIVPDDPDTFTVSEHAVATDVVGNMAAYDQDGGQNLAYTIQSGNDDGIFAIDNTGQITVTDTTNLNFEDTNVYTLTIRATDDGAGGLFAEKTITINVQDINDAPTDVMLSGTGVSEDSFVGAYIATLSSTDEDMPGDTFTYTIIDDPDNKFAIVGDQLFLNEKVDYETVNMHEVTIRTFDGGLSFDRVFSINVLDVDENPNSGAVVLDEDIFDNYNGGVNDEYRSLFDNDYSTEFENDLREDRALSSLLNGDMMSFDRAVYGADGLGQIIYENVVMTARSMENSMVNDENGQAAGAQNLIIDGKTLEDAALNAEQSGEMGEESSEELTALHQAIRYYDDVDRGEPAETTEETKVSAAALDSHINNTSDETYVKFRDVLTYHQTKHSKLIQALLD